MRRVLVSAVVLFGVIVAPLSADLRFTSKMTAKAVAGAPGGGGLFDTSAMVGQIINEQFGGPDGIEMITTVREDGRTRVEYVGAFAGLPAGAVVITQADGSGVGFDAAAKTWWTMPSPQSDPEIAAMLAEMKPEVTTSRSGEFATVSGMRAERVSMRMRMPIPLPEGMDLSMLPPELAAMIPREIVIEGDNWVSSEFSKYTKASSAALNSGPLAQFGLDKLEKDLAGFPVRSVLRTSAPMALEFETVVTKAGEEAVPASAFEVPAGFREIPFPGGL